MKGRPGRILKFFRLSGREKSLFCEAVFLQFWAGLLLKVVPFRLIRWLYSTRQFQTPGSAKDQSRHNVSGRQTDGLQPQSERLNDIRTAIKRGAKVSPWKNGCLVSSLAARRMLRWRRINSKLFLGVTKEKSGKMTEHAWLLVEGEEIVPRNGDYLPLYEF